MRHIKTKRYSTDMYKGVSNFGARSGGGLLTKFGNIVTWMLIIKRQQQQRKKVATDSSKE